MAKRETSDEIRAIERAVLAASNISDVPRRARKQLDEARERMRKLAARVEQPEEEPNGEAA